MFSEEKWTINHDVLKTVNGNSKKFQAYDESNEQYLGGAMKQDR